MITSQSSWVRLAVWACAALLLTACATTGRHVTDWGEITLAPGDTGSCQSNPCRLYLEMPAGEGKYRVTARGLDIGEYPAGQTVSLGSFFESSAIRLPGTNLPVTYLYVPNPSGDVQ